MYLLQVQGVSQVGGGKGSIGQRYFGVIAVKLVVNHRPRLQSP